jgi:hypothetical protein
MFLPGGTRLAHLHFGCEARQRIQLSNQNFTSRSSKLYSTEVQKNVRNSASWLLATFPENLALSSSVELFHRKALLVDTVNRQFDDLDSQQIKAYMTCRVAIATKDDFDLTPANRIQTGSETERRNRGFFQNEANVEMD